MEKVYTTEGFILRAYNIHGNRYDYSKVRYVGFHTKVCIVCPIHGDFWQTPNVHYRGNGCRKCGQSKKDGYVFGLGINDVQKRIFKDGKIEPSYSHWREMIKRCAFKPYDNCSCCEEWLRYSNFLDWFNSEDSGYKEGYALDKNILVKGNTLYSPSTCCFVPQEINNLVQNNKQHRGKTPIGVKQMENGKYGVRPNKHFSTRGLGQFDTREDAFAQYKRLRENHIQEVATQYYNEGKITKRVYDALMKYEVEITD